MKGYTQLTWEERDSVDPCKYNNNEAQDKALQKRKKARKKPKIRDQLKEEIIQKLLKNGVRNKFLDTWKAKVLG